MSMPQFTSPPYPTVVGSESATPSIFTLTQQLSEVDGKARRNRQRCMAAVLQFADAWQLLARVPAPDSAKHVNLVGGKIFRAIWAPVSAEVFMSRTPEKSSEVKVEARKDAEPLGEVYVKQAQWRIAEAWSLLDEMEDEAEADAALMRKLGTALFKEDFQAAMFDARVRRSEQRAKGAINDAGPSKVKTAEQDERAPKDKNASAG